MHTELADRRDQRSPDSVDPVRLVILDAAERSIARWGLRVTMGDIAADAGIQRPHLYRTFASKEALICAVLVRGARRLSEERLERFPLEGPAPALVTEVLVAGQDRLDGDQFMAHVTAGGSQLTMRLLGSESSFVEAQAMFWKPVLAYGQQRGELRSDLSVSDLVRWLLLSQMTIYERREFFPTRDDVRDHLARFVVAALRSPAPLDLSERSTHDGP